LDCGEGEIGRGANDFTGSRDQKRKELAFSEPTQCTSGGHEFWEGGGIKVSIFSQRQPQFLPGGGRSTRGYEEFDREGGTQKKSLRIDLGP